MKRPGQHKLHVVPISFRDASRFINQYHRTHLAPRGQKWAVGIVDEDNVLRGVATCGRPISRAIARDPLIVEVTRTCTDGCPNANSALYGACHRIATAMGYKKIITDTQENESGTSLVAAGWTGELFREPRKNWSGHSVKRKEGRNPDEPSGIRRKRWSKEIQKEMFL